MNKKLHTCFIFVFLLFTCSGLYLFVYSNTGYTLTTNEEKSSVFYDTKDINFTLWPHDKECSRFVTQFSKDLPVVFLVSFPRSGNTWVRYLLEGATGVFTSAIYKDQRAVDVGFLGEKEPNFTGRTLVLKTHEHSVSNDVDWSIVKRFSSLGYKSPVILIIRNPFESILSYWSLYVSSLRGMKKDKSSLFYTVEEDMYHSEGFHEFVASKIPEWRMLAEDRLIWAKNIMVVFYEDLIKDPIREVNRMLEFLQFKANDERLSCLARNIEGPAKKKPHTLKKNPYTMFEKINIAHAVATITALANLRNIEVPDVYYQLLNNHTCVMKEVSV